MVFLNASRKAKQGGIMMNKVIRRQIHFMDIMAATPFRMLKQMAPENNETKFMHEALSAMEGLARSPFKMALDFFEDDGYQGFVVDQE
jgi:hypothetical protein